MFTHFLHLWQDRLKIYRRSLKMFLCKWQIANDMAWTMMMILTSMMIIHALAISQSQCMYHVKHSAMSLICCFVFNFCFFISFVRSMFVLSHFLWIEWHWRNLRTWIHFYLYCKLRIISLTSELPTTNTNTHTHNRTGCSTWSKILYLPMQINYMLFNRCSHYSSDHFFPS